MLHFLPMINPNVDEDDNYLHYDTNLDLSKMPQGLRPGLYARSIVSSMNIARRVSQYGDRTTVLPTISWKTLIEHLLKYSEDNGWADGEAEDCVQGMLDKGAQVTGYWTADLVEWPFSGDQCLLTWADKVISSHMLRAIKTEQQRGAPETSGNECTQLGRWFGQRLYLLDQAPEVIQHLVFYVETVDSMSEAGLQHVRGRNNGNHVLFCGMGRDRMRTTARKGRRTGNMDRMLSNVLRHPTFTEWADQGFRSFALGLAWEMRAQGNSTIYDKLSQLINAQHMWTSTPQLALCMNDTAWVKSTMDNMVHLAKEDLRTLVRRGKHYGVEAFYPQKMDFRTQREQFKNILDKAIGNSEWTQALYKMTLASSLRAHFCQHTNYYDLDHERVQQATPALDVMPQETREALFEEMVQYIAAIPSFGGKAHRDTNPWGSYMDAVFDAWASQQEDDLVETKTALGFFVEWLDQWKHPVQEDLRMMSMINNEAETLGTWLGQALIQRKNPVPVDMGQDVAHLLHELFDFTAETGETTATFIPVETPAPVNSVKSIPDPVATMPLPMDLGDVGGLF